MNFILMENIVKHVFASLGLIPSSFINTLNMQSLLDNDFLLKENLNFEKEDGQLLSNKIWGCQLLIDNQLMKILVGNCSQEINQTEYCVIIHLENMPIYGLYSLIDNNLNGINAEPLLGLSINKTDWLECNTYLQATFLAGMEQLKERNILCKKCFDYSEEYKMILSFIEYHSSFYEALDVKRGMI